MIRRGGVLDWPTDFTYPPPSPAAACNTRPCLSPPALYLQMWGNNKNLFTPFYMKLVYGIICCNRQFVIKTLFALTAGSTQWAVHFQPRRKIKKFKENLHKKQHDLGSRKYILLALKSEQTESFGKTLSSGTSSSASFSVILFCIQVGRGVKRRMASLSCLRRGTKNQLRP